MATSRELFSIRKAVVDLPSLNFDPIGQNWEDRNTVRSRYKRQLIQPNINKSGQHGLEWKNRDPYFRVDDSFVTRTHCSVRSRCKRQLIELNMNESGLHGLDCKTRDPYSLQNDSLIKRTHCS